MIYILSAVFIAYANAAIHALLAFFNKRRTVERVAVWSVILGFVLHTAALVRIFLPNNFFFGLRETLLVSAWTLTAVYLLAIFKSSVKALDIFVLPLTSLVVFSSLFLSAADDNSLGLLESLSGIWLNLHTGLWFAAYACLFVVFAVSAMYLVQENELKKKTFGTLFHRLPSLSTVNKVAWTATLTGFLLVSVGILSGMYLSFASEGKIWQNDPKEIFSGLTWLIYLILVCYRLTADWRGRRAAWLGIVGFAFVLLTLFGTRALESYHVFG